MDKSRELKNHPEATLQGIDISSVSVPMSTYQETLYSAIQTATQNGREDEREELVCRLLANEVPVSEIAVVLRIRENEIKLIEQNNISEKIPTYNKKLQERRKRRQKLSM